MQYGALVAVCVCGTYGYHHADTYHTFTSGTSCRGSQIPVITCIACQALPVCVVRGIVLEGKRGVAGGVEEVSSFAASPGPPVVPAFTTVHMQAGAGEILIGFVIPFTAGV